MNDNFSINKIWTMQEGIKARKMNEQGHTAREIGAALGRSRNSVVGWFHRQGISLNNAAPMSPEAKAERARRAYHKRGKQPPKPLPDDTIPRLFKNSKTKEPIVQPPNELHVTFLGLTNAMCKAVIGEPKALETLYCGEKPLKAGHSWCEYHHNLYFGQRKSNANGERKIISRGDKIFERFGS